MTDTETNRSKSQEEVLEEASTVAAKDERVPVGLSVVSKQYDRGNKGYLDEDEEALRRMDSQNMGHLDVNKTLRMFQELKESQKQNVTNRRIIIALTVFAVLLSLANIGTAFAAATLAKDSEVQSDQLVSKDTGERLTITPRTYFVNLDVSTDEDDQATVSSGNSRNLFTSRMDTISAYNGWLVAKSLCTNIPRQFRISDPDTFVCETGGTDIAVQHCGYYTHAFSTGVPTISTNTNGGGFITFHFDAFRGRLFIGVIGLRCSLSSNARCDVGNVDATTTTELYCQNPCHDVLCGGVWWCDDGDTCDYESGCDQCKAV